jgi:hypothetical protein
MPRSALAILFCLTLGACSISEFLPNLTPEDVAGAEPPYRFIIANRLKDVVGDPAGAGDLQISGARRVDSIKGASWLVCIKAQRYPLPRFYAVFFQRDRIVDSRLSVVIDQCELQSYTPFDWVADANTVPNR